jgi:hypothetical protein
MCINPRFIAQKSRARPRLKKPKRTRAKPRKPGPNCKGFLEVEGYFCDFRNCGGFFAKRRLKAEEELKWRHVADSGWLATDVSVTRAVDQRWTTVDRSTVDQPKGHTPDLIRTVHRRSGSGGDPRATQGGKDGRRRRRATAGGGGLAGSSPVTLKLELPVAKRYGTRFKTKLER